MKLVPMPPEEEFVANPDPEVWDIEAIRHVQQQLKKAEMLNDFEEIERLSQLSRQSFLRKVDVAA